MYYRYICLADGTFYNGRPWQKDSIIETRKGTPPDGFEATTQDIPISYRGFYQGIDGTVYYGEKVYVWEDYPFPLTRAKQGILDKPDYDFTNMGMLFPQDDVTEIAYLQDHLPHAMRIGSPLRPHVHFNQTSGDTPVFKMDFRIFPIGGDPTGSFDTYTASTFGATYVSGTLFQVATFPEIPGDITFGLTPWVDIKLYRDDDVVSGDVVTKKFDLHYQKDSFGSSREYQK